MPRKLHVPARFMNDVYTIHCSYFRLFRAFRVVRRSRSSPLNQGVEMFGVLLDVSGSMQQAYALDKSHDATVQRTHAVFSTVANIVKREADRHNMQESIFASVFGLDGPSTTCDLVSLLEILRESRRQKDDSFSGLVDIAKQHKVQHMEKWIRKYLTEMEAALLCHSLRSDTSLIPTFLEMIPSSGFLEKAAYGITTEKMAHNSKIYSLVRRIIFDNLKPNPQPKPIQFVSELFDNLLRTHADSSAKNSDELLQNRVENIVKAITPYIYGRTPMRKAMKDALSVFRCAGRDDAKVLFILSDGVSTDGDPRPIAEELHALGVKIVTCFLTSDSIENPRRLFDTIDPSWARCNTSWYSTWMSHDGRAVLFEMSSTMQNAHTPLSFLVDANWQLPLSGESRLFVQANSLDVVNELCQVVVSQLTMDCDALIDVLEKVPLGIYINQKNADFVPKKQEKATCYANAIAAVFHLAMSRIVGREGGIPDFYVIRERIISAYGLKGAKTRYVLRDVCPEYRLHFQNVDEAGARQAINRRRPVVATFSLYDEQWHKFSNFFKTTKKGILTRDSLISKYTSNKNISKK